MSCRTPLRPPVRQEEHERGNVVGFDVATGEAMDPATAGAFLESVPELHVPVHLVVRVSGLGQAHMGLLCKRGASGPCTKVPAPASLHTHDRMLSRVPTLFNWAWQACTTTAIWRSRPRMCENSFDVG